VRRLYESTAAGDRANQAFVTQLAESFAHRRAAEVELLTELALRGKRITRPKLAIHNLRSQEVLQL
jgi:hypothetical protein